MTVWGPEQLSTPQLHHWDCHKDWAYPYLLWCQWSQEQSGRSRAAPWAVRVRRILTQGLLHQCQQGPQGLLPKPPWLIHTTPGVQEFRPSSRRTFWGSAGSPAGLLRPWPLGDTEGLEGILLPGGTLIPGGAPKRWL